MNPRREAGFTLVELVTTLTLTAIVASFAAYFLTVPIEGYAALSRRAVLVDRAEMALRRIGRDLRRALPNSVRVSGAGGVVAVELLDTLDGVRYRTDTPPGDPDRVLDFAAPDDAFNSIGPFSVAKPFSSTTAYLSIYNVGVTGANAWDLANVITPPGTQIDIAAAATPDEDRVTLSPPFRFRYGSPGQRLFLVSGPVTWLCDAVGGTLTRYTGYAIDAAQSNRDSDAELMAAGATRTLVSDSISACGFNYTPGTAQRAGLVSAQLEDADAGERITLQHQIHVVNAPHGDDRKRGKHHNQKDRGQKRKAALRVVAVWPHGA
ncbi:MAG: prepilin-type N-terminal cleavage/methylation domain-containing protein, partial [Pseudomonadota bacterium]